MTLTQTVNIAGSEIKVSATLKTLGVKLNSTLTFESHINDTIRACNFHIRAFRHLRRGLTKEVANTMACSIVGSRIDYATRCYVAQVTRFLTNYSASKITLRALSVTSADEIITQLTYCGVYTGYLSEVV